LCAGDPHAYEELICYNQYIVIEEVLYFVGKGVELIDLIQIANVALATSLEKYVHRKATLKGSMKTYLHRNIYRQLQNNFRDIVSLVRYPLNRFDYIVNYHNDYFVKHYNSYTVHFIIQEDLKNITYKNKDYNLIDFNVPYFRLPVTILDSFDTGDDPAELYCYKTAPNELLDIISELKPIERDIVIKYFGLGNCPIKTLQEIGKDYGLTRERIRQILEKAITRLKHPQRSRRLKGLLKYMNTSFDHVQSTGSDNLLHFCLLDPFNSTWAEEKDAIRLLEEYVAPCRRKTPYPELKSMAEACRRKIISTLNSLGRPCTYNELRDYVYETFPLLKSGVYEYALSTIDAVIETRKRTYVLKEWGYLETPRVSKPQEIPNEDLKEAIFIHLRKQSVPITFRHLLSYLAHHFLIRGFSTSDEQRILRIIKRNEIIYKTLDNRYYLIREEE